MKLDRSRRLCWPVSFLLAAALLYASLRGVSWGEVLGRWRYRAETG